MLVKLVKLRIRNRRFDVFCTGTWFSIRTRYRYFTSYYPQIDKRLKFVIWLLAQMERELQCLLNAMRMNEAHFSLQCDVNTQNNRIWGCQTFVSARPTNCILLMRLFGVVSTHLSFWALSFLKSLVLNPAGKPVQSLQVSYAIAWPCGACIAEKTCIFCRHLHGVRYPPSFCTWRQDVPVGHFHWRPSDKSHCKFESPPQAWLRQIFDYGEYLKSHLYRSSETEGCFSRGRQWHRCRRATLSWNVLS